MSGMTLRKAYSWVNIAFSVLTAGGEFCLERLTGVWIGEASHVVTTVVIALIIGPWFFVVMDVLFDFMWPKKGQTS